jgi:hypothetical protein
MIFPISLRKRGQSRRPEYDSKTLPLPLPLPLPGAGGSDRASHHRLLQGRLPGRQEELLSKLDQNYIFQNSV